MAFKAYHYEHVNDFIRYYASELVRLDIIEVLDNGISNETDAKLFCDFIPTLLEQRLVDEKLGKDAPVDIGSAIISDLHYERPVPLSAMLALKLCGRPCWIRCSPIAVAAITKEP